MRAGDRPMTSPFHKIRPDSLREFALGNSTEARAVVVFLNVPIAGHEEFDLATVRPGHPPLRYGCAKRVVRSSLTAEQLEERRRIRAAAKAFLRNVVASSLQDLNERDLFGVRANAEQLRRICENELVREILPAG